MEAAVTMGGAELLRWIVLLPLAGAAANGLAGAPLQRRLGKRAVGLVACTPVVLAFLGSCRAALSLAALPPSGRYLLDRVLPWIHVGSLHVDIAFAADPLAVVMMLVVTGVGGLIHFYSIGYMHEDRSYWRFFALLNLFTFAMLTLVMADNLLLLFVGWEGVGLCSYALIGFWYRDHANTTAGNKAFIVNRVGDFGFVLGIFLLFWTLAAQGHGTLVFREMEARAPLLAAAHFWGFPVATLAALLLFVGATGKSAQVPLYVWLPDAMAGPTPVSALIHAATMVTAGVYMVGRMHFLYSLAPTALAVVAVVGALTALVAATIAVVQTDIKRVLAYSTVSQLGYMMLAMGVGAYATGIFHLVTHAFFKACLFLGAGSVMHALGGEQDMRKMGGLARHLPKTAWTFLVAAAALAGAPPLAGFFSKDEILWHALTSPHGHVLLWATGFLVAGLTSFYMSRQAFLVFFGPCRVEERTRHHLHESPAVMTVPLVVLAVGAMLAGFVGLPAVLGPNWFSAWLAPVFGGEHAAVEGSAGLEAGLMAASVAMALAGFALAYLIYYRGTLSADRFSELLGGVPYRWVLAKYYVDELYDLVFVRGCLLAARAGAAFDHYVIDFLVDGSARLTAATSWLNGLFDNWVVDGLVNRVADGTLSAGNRLRRVQTGAINTYLYVILAGAVAADLVRRWLLG